MSCSINGHGSNNIAELTGILRAIMKLSECNFTNDVEIFTDSSYSIQSIWKVMNGIQLYSNHELIKEIEFAIELCNCRIDIKWVRGHKDDYGNIVADILAGNCTKL